MTQATELLQGIANDFARVIPDVDEETTHDRWDPGIGPFEEERQLEMLLDFLATGGDVPDNIEREVNYPKSGRRCDIVVRDGHIEIPIEAKLLVAPHGCSEADRVRIHLAVWVARYLLRERKRGV